MAFGDSFSHPDKGQVNAARHRADAVVAARLAVVTKVLDASATRQFTCDDRWFYFTANQVKYTVSAKLLSL